MLPVWRAELQGSFWGRLIDSGSCVPGEALSLPGIKDLDAKAGEILRIPRDDGKSVLNGRRRDHAVYGVGRSPL